MDSAVYSLKVTDNGDEDPVEVVVSVPTEYESLPISGITVMLGGYNGFAADIAITEKSGSMHGSFYVAKINLSKTGVRANYRSTIPCGDTETTEKFVSYHLPFDM